MPRYKLTVAYDGTDFHGWQRQADSDGATADPLRTVQGVLEEAIANVAREPVTVLGASRTDAGVHARGQVAVFGTKLDIPPQRLLRAVNSRLPDDVQVRQCEVTDDQFDPIRDCVGKGYRYRIAHSCAEEGVLRPLFDRHLVAWTPYRLDPVAMNCAARSLVGEHDFASFTRLHHGREHTVRTVFDCRVEAIAQRRCNLHVSGSGFLYNMVRIIAGTLIDVGRGHVNPDRIPEILAAHNRQAAGPTAPAQGLCLMWVRYP